MDRLVLITLIAALAGCSGASDKSDDNNDNGDDNSSTPNSSTPNNANTNPNSGPGVRPDLVESDACFTAPARLNLSADELAYVTASENTLFDPRSDHGANCGSALPIDIDWEAAFASRGFDDDELDDPVAVAAAVIPFLEGAAAYCFGPDGSIYRENVTRVLLTATDTASRVGLCFDSTAGVLVSRFMLEPDGVATTQWTAGEVTDWLGDNL